MKKISNKEFIWYLVCGVIAVFGILLMIFGIVGNHMTDVAYNDNFIKVFEDTNGIDLRLWGIIFMAIGVIVAVIVLLVNARKSDKEREKQIRREQRLAAEESETIEVKNAVEFVEEEK